MHDLEDDSRRIIFESTAKEHLDLGAHKPVSYLPITAIETVLGLGVADYVRMSEERGNKCFVVQAGQGFLRTGAVYSYDPRAAQAVVAAHRQFIVQCGFTADAGQLVEEISKRWFDIEEPILPIVRLLFGEEAGTGTLA